jgi:hypothetical protein
MWWLCGAAGGRRNNAASGRSSTPMRKKRGLWLWTSSTIFPDRRRNTRSAISPMAALWVTSSTVWLESRLTRWRPEDDRELTLRDDKVDVTQGMYCGLALTEGLPYLGHLDNHFTSLSELAREPRLARNGFGPDRFGSPTSPILMWCYPPDFGCGGPYSSRPCARR